MPKAKISFPHLGNYCIPIEIFLTMVLDCEYLTPPPITKHTLELGSRYSPDFVCAPFKYNLGCYIEALENGADTLIQTSGVCRLSYYGEVQEQILKDLGYKFDFINFADGDITKPTNIYHKIKQYNPNITIKDLAKALYLAIRMIDIMDKTENFIRENVGFEEVEGTLDNLYQAFLQELKTVRSQKELKQKHKRYLKMMKQVKINKPENPLKVGMIGEYYTIMEPFSNHFMEKELAKKGIVITRRMNISNSIFFRRPNSVLKHVKKYLKYDIGATGMDSIRTAEELAKQGYDGIIHVKSFGCTPEMDAMPVLVNISQEYKIPILYFSFDSQTSETGIQTRIEAFYDMIVMRKEKKSEKSISRN